MPRPPQPRQQCLPLEPQPPSPGEVDAAVVQLLQERPYWLQRYGAAAQVLADPQRAQLLRECARRALATRRRQPPAKK